MKQTNRLKVLRVILAILFFVPLLLFFILPANKLPDHLHIFGHIQLLPAILNGMFILVVGLLLLTLFFGRIYCSVICPAGVLQDIINRLYCIGKKKKKGSRRFRYHKPQNWLRYVLLILTGGLALFGFMELCTLLDPYSNFGRIAGNLFRPVAFWINNILAGGLNKMGNYALVYTSVRMITTVSLVAASVAFVVFVGMVVFRGRLFCNTLCPVGTLLSLVSRYSFFRIAITEDKCTRCKICEQTCKAEAINTATMTVDMSRCVDCFSCLSSCKQDAIQYQFKPSLWGEKNVITSQKSIRSFSYPVRDRMLVENGCYTPYSVPSGTQHSSATHSAPRFLTRGKWYYVSKHSFFRYNRNTKSSSLGNEEEVVSSANHSRRAFLATSATVAASLPVAMLKAKQNQYDFDSESNDHQDPVTPPGSISITHFKRKCTACHLCVTRCPSNVLRPAGFEYGFSYLLKPHMSFHNSFCNYACTVCGEVCPTGAIKPITEEDKKTIQVGIARLYLDRCIVNTEETDCGACSEHCPTQAVHMVPYKGTLTIPQIEPDLCIGCGGCESICPVNPKRAIFVVANKIHLKAEKPPEEEKLDVKLDDFGF